MNESLANLEFEDVVDMRQLVARLAAGRWWIVIGAGIFCAVFTAVAILTPPKYRAVVVVVSAGVERSGMSGSLNSIVGSLGGLTSLAGLNLGGGDAATAESLAVLRSRQFTESFINDRKLVPLLFAKKWNQATGKWKVSDQDIPTSYRAFRYFDEEVRSIVEDNKTKLIRVQIDWKDRHDAADWANDLVLRLNSEMRRRAVAKAEASLVFLERELSATTEIGEREALFRLVESQIRQRMLATVTQEYAFRVVDRAMAPDADDPAQPKKIYLVAAGLLVGSLLGALTVLLFGADKSKHAKTSD